MLSLHVWKNLFYPRKNEGRSCAAHRSRGGNLIVSVVTPDISLRPAISGNEVVLTPVSSRALISLSRLPIARSLPPQPPSLLFLLSAQCDCYSHSYSYMILSVLTVWFLFSWIACLSLIDVWALIKNPTFSTSQRGAMATEAPHTTTEKVKRATRA